jgi:hypothetical protein
MLAGAVVATAGIAHAQQRPAVAVPAVEADASQAAVPWYEHFTTSNGLTQAITGDRENDRTIAPAWSLSQHWGITVDVREAQRIERDPVGGRGDQASVGAFYQFTPGLRVGGQVSLETPHPGDTTVSGARTNEPRAGVRIESAFRF